MTYKSIDNRALNNFLCNRIGTQYARCEYEAIGDDGWSVNAWAKRGRLVSKHSHFLERHLGLFYILLGSKLVLIRH